MSSDRPEHTWALINECRPGVSMRELSRDAGLNARGLDYYLTRPLVDVPKTDILTGLAHACRAPLARVCENVARDIPVLPPWGTPELSPDEEAVLREYRKVPPESRESVRNVMRAFANERRP